jgi:hypothetical protein
MSFTKKKIDISFSLAGPAQPGDKGSTAAAKGLRVSAHIKAVSSDQPTAQIKIYGMNLSWMNRLCTIGMPRQGSNQNTVTISAGDDVSGMATVFVGNIQMCFPDLNESPDSPMVIEAVGSVYDQMQPITPNSFPNGADVATILSGIANQMNYRFVNNGVTLQIPPQYLWGTAVQQIEKIKSAAPFEIDISGGVMTIWPAGGSRAGAVPVISKETGMIGYPRYFENGISLDTEFNPQITIGSQIQVKSIIQAACKTWPVIGVEHHLEAEVPDGTWLTHCDCGDPTVRNI